MYEYIHGKLVDKTPTKAVVESCGLGYRLMLPLSTYTKLPNLKEEVTLFLSQIVREDSHTLYAFFSKAERDLFELLITISGIGPKTGLSLIGHLELDVLERAVHTGDVKLLSKVPGIGKKTAERLIIEMRDKYKGVKPDLKHMPLQEKGLLGDAMSALINLGYHPLAAQKAAQAALAANKDEIDLGKVITSALKHCH
ncbi:MAG: Holliday junction DNA helicase RuvA [Chlamydiae bacterium RIFCSPHIGHO2_12_FULL_44_59]|nr:MAG: Holliday junction DNA helicase RuvA [Chlamydiae bacterium RIFCSPHIGHO2_01_FULL_44_39]OGN60389.1 MAG: Holliday junction DNA helicase RuvA [Chlamydiae bacterium RIFCSPHIGHO2_12_FULL_44_59]OGN66374.1 MAG: Holliday junction DNA helicase RuvA [Chlamydiae bacterium RIFCSPLOWO2_01_FULL_44_52]OGN69407.1 MAG: Holliday junction DNA helicase RuvA [Chlamydiae bacterium RIFCSPLOWO2_02_FULL_45_22]OGN70560.1 MAG: Holliday junction DNA helicase RuvA [Chlamydiae bacterium RIFCSPLOWO2_12_FULL_45_20]